jgi:GNAT superfamily N-acetyltransferase
LDRQPHGDFDQRKDVTATNSLKRPRDPIQLGKLIVDIATGQVEGSTPTLGISDQFATLEDLFVASEARGNGAGRILIERLVSLGEQHGWLRLYCHTHENNCPARKLYDRLALRQDYFATISNSDLERGDEPRKQLRL